MIKNAEHKHYKVLSEQHGVFLRPRKKIHSFSWIMSMLFPTGKGGVFVEQCELSLNKRFRKNVGWL